MPLSLVSLSALETVFPADEAPPSDCAGCQRQGKLDIADEVPVGKTNAILNILWTQLRALTELIEGELQSGRLCDEALRSRTGPRVPGGSRYLPQEPGCSSLRACSSILPTPSSEWRGDEPKVRFQVDMAGAVEAPRDRHLQINTFSPYSRWRRESGQRLRTVVVPGAEEAREHPQCRLTVPDLERQWFAHRFRLFDVRGKGDLSAQECRNMLLRHGMEISFNQVKRMLLHVRMLTSDQASSHEPIMSLDEYIYVMTQSEWHANPEISSNLDSLRQALELEGEMVEKPGTHASAYKSSRSNHSAPDPPPRSLVTWGLDTIPAVVIILNAFAIGLEADYGSDYVWAWEICELFFAFFFTSEFVVKVMHVGCRSFWASASERLWNYFDVFCIMTALFDMAITYGNKMLGVGGFKLEGLMLIKMLRLARLARLVRLLRFKIFIELKMMIQGVVSGVRVLLWAIVLLFTVVFILGILMRKLVGEGHEEFGSLPRAMFTLFRCFTDGCTAYNGTPLQERLRTDYGALWMFFYVLVILFVTIGIFNLIMAIFIDNVVTAHMQRKQANLGKNAGLIELKICEVIAKRFENLDDASMRDDGGKLEKTLSAISCHEITTPTAYDYAERRRNADEFLEVLAEQQGVVTKDVFESWLHDPEIVDLLEEAEIETSTKYDLFDALDVDSGGELSVEELVCGLMKLRGPISKNDIVATRLKVGYMTELIEDICRKIGVELACDNACPRVSAACSP